MRRADVAVIDTSMRLNKRFKPLHRTVVSGQQSASFLTVPIERHGLAISDHNEWWQTMVSTLETLYGATPFFHLYKNDFLSHIGQQAVSQSIIDLNINLILAVRRLAGITTPLTVRLDERYLSGDASDDVEIVDLRNFDFYADAATRSVIEDLFKNPA